jgi:hypothetical protein
MAVQMGYQLVVKMVDQRVVKMVVQKGYQLVVKMVDQRVVKMVVQTGYQLVELMVEMMVELTGDHLVSQTEQQMAHH